MKKKHTKIRILKRIFQLILIILLIPSFYFLVSIILTSITINNKQNLSEQEKSIFLNTNGIHLDIVIPVKHITNELISDLNYTNSDQFLAFGWGNKDYYLNTRSMHNLNVINTFDLLFCENPTLIHIIRHKTKKESWVKVTINDRQLNKLNKYILNTFKRDKENKKKILKGKSYGSYDDFYEANGSYSYSMTCNTWVNSGFKKSGLKACYWTPFDYGLLNKYRQE